MAEGKVIVFSYRIGLSLRIQIPVNSNRLKNNLRVLGTRYKQIKKSQNYKLHHQFVKTDKNNYVYF